MKVVKWFVLVLVVAQLLFSCETVRISENLKYKESQFVFGVNKTAIIVANENVRINEFTKTFDKKYKQKHDFVKAYDSLCAVKIKQEKLFGNVIYDESLKFLSNDPLSFTQEQHIKVDSLFANSSADYLIKICDYEVTNSIQGSPGVFVPNAGGGMNMMGGGQSENCIIKSRFQIYDMKTRTKVLDFVSQGSGSVVFFAFEKAFMNAMDSSIKNSVAYLKTGKLKF